MIKFAFKSDYKRSPGRPYLNPERKLASLPHECLITAPHTLMLSPYRAFELAIQSPEHSGDPEALSLIRHSLDRCP
jgi:hypothetical protein